MGVDSVEGRSQRARRLARRIGRKAWIPETPVGWAGVVSVWVHLALALALLLTPRGGEARHSAAMASLRSGLVLSQTDPDRALPGAERRSESSAGPGQGLAVSVMRLTPEEPTQRVARTSEVNALETAPEDAVAISAHHTAADDLAAAPVTSSREGLPTPVSRGSSDLPSAPTLERVPGDAEAAMGNQAEADPGFVTLGGGGGGANGEGNGDGTPGSGGQVAPGGPTGGARAGAVAQAPGGKGIDVRSGVPTGPDPTRAEGATPSWWQPLAVRWSGADSAPGPSVASTVVGNTVARGRAPVERPNRGVDSGGSDHPTGASSPLPTAPTITVGTRRIAAPGTADPIDELRMALGFGPLDRSRLAPRPEWAGRMFEDGMADSSPQTVFAGAPIAWRTAISTEGTAMGSYIQRAEELIDARWFDGDLDPHSRAIGLQGDVTVQFQVRPDGRTGRVSVVRSSGNAVLDDLAIQSVPVRLPRFPSGLEKVPFVYSVTLHYRNPLIGP